ncbi:ADP-ribosylation factor 4 [Podila humilis]|nr:ADP-ribosylation factor 4 [Podila humilis]
MLYRMSLGKVVITSPTIGFNRDIVQYKNKSFDVWDISGMWGIRQLWHHYFKDAAAVIYVIDASDRERISEAREDLMRLGVEDELRNAPFLVMANKQDLPGCMSVLEIYEQLGLDYFKRFKDRHQFHIQPCSVKEGQGLEQGLEWLSRQSLSKQK